MARVKISEFRAKSIVNKAFNRKYSGVSIQKDQKPGEKTKNLPSENIYVVKVDEGVKKRGKSGLLFTNVKKQDISAKTKELFEKGYNQVLVEEYVPHDKKAEKYLSLERVRGGVKAIYSNSGGVNIEESKDEVKETTIPGKGSDEIDSFFGLSNFTDKLLNVFESNYFSFLETNPFIINDQKPIFLDLAIEVDDAAELMSVGAWSEKDFVESSTKVTPEEISVNKLAEGSSASLKLKVLNPKGSVFTIFSGGGASIVLADEIGNVGKASELADYAEYSGNPNEEETYLFTKNILSLVKKSPAKDKVVYIAGGVANFTDIRSTFKGVIRALNEDGSELRKQGVKIYVRRGGPHQEEGLRLIKKALTKQEILGRVVGPEEVLTDIITKR